MQALSEIENERQQKIDSYLKVASARFKDDLSARENIHKEILVNVTSSENEVINKDLIVDNKPIFEELFINDEFVDRDL